MITDDISLNCFRIYTFFYQTDIKKKKKQFSTSQQKEKYQFLLFKQFGDKIIINKNRI